MCRRHWWQCYVLSAILTTHLVTEVSYFTHICIYAPSIGFQKSGHSDLIVQMVAILVGSTYVHVLPAWLSLEPSYLAQLYVYTRATHTEGIMELAGIFNPPPVGCNSCAFSSLLLSVAVTGALRPMAASMLAT